MVSAGFISGMMILTDAPQWIGPINQRRFIEITRDAEDKLAQEEDHKSSTAQPRPDRQWDIGVDHLELKPECRYCGIKVTVAGIIIVPSMSANQTDLPTKLKRAKA